MERVQGDTPGALQSDFISLCYEAPRSVGDIFLSTRAEIDITKDLDTKQGDIYLLSSHEDELVEITKQLKEDSGPTYLLAARPWMVMWGIHKEEVPVNSYVEAMLDTARRHSVIYLWNHSVASAYLRETYIEISGELRWSLLQEVAKQFETARIAPGLTSRFFNPVDEETAQLKVVPGDLFSLVNEEGFIIPIRDETYVTDSALWVSAGLFKGIMGNVARHGTEDGQDRQLTPLGEQLLHENWWECSDWLDVFGRILTFDTSDVFEFGKGTEEDTWAYISKMLSDAKEQELDRISVASGRWTKSKLRREISKETGNASLREIMVRGRG